MSFCIRCSWHVWCRIHATLFCSNIMVRRARDMPEERYLDATRDKILSMRALTTTASGRHSALASSTLPKASSSISSPVAGADRSLSVDILLVWSGRRVLSVPVSSLPCRLGQHTSTDVGLLSLRQQCLFQRHTRQVKSTVQGCFDPTSPNFWYALFANTVAGETTEHELIV